ncbi:hypothetical protein FVE85_6639 [Porphyridium purpureum]|uniref:Ku domain-containing protein n=1 Tax=Porphyridium purpureum TaxID=35688 RepID=A0A5J4Z7R8_PORPP|nr:hypothetical protein FVE85_6639 [Porphyridium purpureum]|eukprot:POR7739..scf295_1
MPTRDAVLVVLDLFQPAQNHGEDSSQPRVHAPLLIEAVRQYIKRRFAFDRAQTAGTASDKLGLVCLRNGACTRAALNMWRAKQKDPHNISEPEQLMCGIELCGKIVEPDINLFNQLERLSNECTSPNASPSSCTSVCAPVQEWSDVLLYASDLLMDPSTGTASTFRKRMVIFSGGLSGDSTSGLKAEENKGHAKQALRALACTMVQHKLEMDVVIYALDEAIEDAFPFPALDGDDQDVLSSKFEEEVRARVSRGSGLSRANAVVHTVLRRLASCTRTGQSFSLASALHNLSQPGSVRRGEFSDEKEVLKGVMQFGHSLAIPIRVRKHVKQQRGPKKYRLLWSNTVGQRGSKIAVFPERDSVAFTRDSQTGRDVYVRNEDIVAVYRFGEGTQLPWSEQADAACRIRATTKVLQIKCVQTMPETLSLHKRVLGTGTFVVHPLETEPGGIAAVSSLSRTLCDLNLCLIALFAKRVGSPIQNVMLWSEEICFSGNGIPFLFMTETPTQEDVRHFPFKRMPSAANQSEMMDITDRLVDSMELCFDADTNQDIEDENEGPRSVNPVTLWNPLRQRHADCVFERATGITFLSSLEGDDHKMVQPACDLMMKRIHVEEGGQKVIPLKPSQYESILLDANCFFEDQSESMREQRLAVHQAIKANDRKRKASDMAEIDPILGKSSSRLEKTVLLKYDRVLVEDIGSMERQRQPTHARKSKVLENLSNFEAMVDEREEDLATVAYREMAESLLFCVASSVIETSDFVAGIRSFRAACRDTPTQCKHWNYFVENVLRSARSDKSALQFLRTVERETESVADLLALLQDSETDGFGLGTDECRHFREQMRAAIAHVDGTAPSEAASGSDNESARVQHELT